MQDSYWWALSTRERGLYNSNIAGSKGDKTHMEFFSQQIKSASWSATKKEENGLENEEKNQNVESVRLQLQLIPRISEKKGEPLIEGHTKYWRGWIERGSGSAILTRIHQ